MHVIRFSKAEQGISLIEVLISLLILSLGALGFAGLQLKGLQSTEDANYRAHATLIAQDAIERMLSNPQQIPAYVNNSYPTGSLGATPPRACSASACSATAMATQDKNQLGWIAANSLPGGRITATNCFSGAQCVIVSWNGAAPGSCITGSGINTAADSTCVVLEVIR